MDFTRNHYLVIGLLLLLTGVQLRLVESFVLNEQATKFLSERFGTSNSAAPLKMPLLAANGPGPRRVVKAPPWLGYALMSIGSVLVLHSLAMKKPDSK